MRTKHGLGLLMAVLLAAPALPQAAQSPEAMLGAALHQERVTGNLQAAIDGYRRLLASKGVSRSLAAQAQYHIGICYEKLGSQEARKAFENVVKNYSDQKEMVAQARARIAAMGGGSTTVSTRQLMVNADQSCVAWNVSQDGRLMGAVEYLTGNMAVVDAVTGECRVLTAWGKWNEKNGFVDQGAISRDGKWLASWHYGAVNDGEIRVVGTDGKGERTVYVRRQPEWAIPTDWSPDGKSILVLFEHSKSGSTQSGTAEIATVASTGGAVKVLKTYEYAVRHTPKILYSPDGSYIAWDHPVQPGSPDTDLVIMPAPGGPEVRIASNPGSDKLVGWTAAGHLVFMSGRTGRLGLYLVRISGGKQSGEPEELRANLPAIKPVGLSANGTFFYSESIPRSDAMVAQLDVATGKLTSEPRPLFPPYPKSTSTASWSPDGRWLAVHRLTEDQNRTTLLIQPAAGGDARELTIPFRMLERTRLVWSPDGRFLHAAGYSPKGPGVFRIDVNSGEIQTIAADRNIMEWTADGRLLFQAGGPSGHHILVTDTRTGQTRTAFENAKAVRAFAVSPDGKRLSFVGSGYSQAEPSPLMILDLETGTARQVDSAWFSHTPSHFAWMPDGNHLLILRNPTGGMTTRGMALIPLNGEPARQLDYKFPAHMNVDGLAIHPDGKTVTWTLSAGEQLWWAMDNFLPAK